LCPGLRHPASSNQDSSRLPTANEAGIQLWCVSPLVLHSLVCRSARAHSRIEWLGVPVILLGQRRVRRLRVQLHRQRVAVDHLRYVPRCGSFETRSWHGPPASGTAKRALLGSNALDPLGQPAHRLLALREHLVVEPGERALCGRIHQDAGKPFGGRDERGDPLLP